MSKRAVPLRNCPSARSRYKYSQMYVCTSNFAAQQAVQACACACVCSKKLAYRHTRNDFSGGGPCDVTSLSLSLIIQLPQRRPLVLVP